MLSVYFLSVRLGHRTLVWTSGCIIWMTFAEHWLIDTRTCLWQWENFSSVWQMYKDCLIFIIIEERVHAEYTDAFFRLLIKWIVFLNKSSKFCSFNWLLHHEQPQVPIHSTLSLFIFNQGLIFCLQALFTCHVHSSLCLTGPKADIHPFKNCCVDLHHPT